MRNIAAACTALSIAGIGPAGADGLFELSWDEVAEGVYVGNRRDPLRYPVVANTTIVVGEKGVLVFDGGGYATQGEQVLAKVRSLTDTPVTHLVISHWHGDHHRGASPIVEAFPDAEIVAHRFTCAAMLDGPERRVKEGEAQLQGTYDAVAAAAEKGEWFDGSKLGDEEKAYFRQFVADWPEYKAQLDRMKVAPPTAIVDDQMKIDLGGKKVVLKHFGRANTAGDIVLHLPKEKIVATGDMVVAPVPYGFGSYPAEWADAIREVAKLDAETIIPGHGAIMTDDSYLTFLADMLDDVARQAAYFFTEPDRSDAATPKFDFAAHAARYADDPVKARLFSIFFTTPIASAAMHVARGASEENEKLDSPVEELCAAD